MRPINLKIEGINSYVSEQTVDFEKVSQSNLFGIFGETGSGKTSILDSIVMALYGTSDRDVIQNIINVHAKKAKIEFEFDTIALEKKVRYLVKRVYFVRPSGIKSDATLINKNTSLTEAEGVDAVNEKILKIIGVAKKEFLKCIALPQGEFDRFLSDTPLSRKKTIAKLFDLEQFGADLQEKIKKRKEQLTLKKLNLEDKLSVFRHISTEQLTSLNILKERKQKERVDLEFLLNQSKTELAINSDDFDKREKLNELKVSLALKKSEQKSIDHLKQQIQYTTKYGNFVIVNTKFNNTTNEIERINNLLSDLKNQLQSNSINQTFAAQKLHAVDAEKTKHAQLLEKLKAEASRRDFLQEKICDNDNEIEKIKGQQKEWNTEIKQSFEELKLLIASVNKNAKVILDANKKLTATNTILQKFENASSVECREEVVEFLSSLKENIEPNNLDEIKTFKIYSQIKEMLKDIANFKKIYQEEIIKIKSDFEELNKVKNTKNYRLSLETQKQQLTELLASTTEIDKQDQQKMYELKTLSQTNKAKIAQSENYIVQLQNDNAKINESLSSLCTKKDVDFQANVLKQVEKDFENENQKHNQLINEKQKIITDIEVNTNLLENNKKKIKEYKEVLKLFEIENTIKNKENLASMMLDEQEYKLAKLKVNEHEKSVAYLESYITELSPTLQNTKVTKEQIKFLENKCASLQQQVNDTSVEIEVIASKILEQNENIEKVKTFAKDLESIKTKLSTVLDLQHILSNGALLDYVSEEYMYLITEFSNSYVYQLSKGKYFLKYNGDFAVIDNFNGGILRGVKTLSGGERFIISLSLALGISQSIATNNNKNFNFFFIDEGFGSLSDSYIEKVLQSFDALIKLDFTVGFITHVEKMQNYITNRIVVTKESNEAGSKLQHFF